MRGGLFCLVAYAQMGGPLSKQSIEPILPMISLQEAVSVLERCGSFTLPKSMSSDKGWKIVRRCMWRESVKRDAADLAASLGLTEADDIVADNEQRLQSRKGSQNRDALQAAAALDGEVAALTSAASGEFRSVHSCLRVKRRS